MRHRSGPFVFPRATTLIAKDHVMVRQKLVNARIIARRPAINLPKPFKLRDDPYLEGCNERWSMRPHFTSLPRSFLNSLIVNREIKLLSRRISHPINPTHISIRNAEGSPCEEGKLRKTCVRSRTSIIVLIKTKQVNADQDYGRTLRQILPRRNRLYVSIVRQVDREFDDVTTDGLDQ